VRGENEIEDEYEDENENEEDRRLAWDMQLPQTPSADRNQGDQVIRKYYVVLLCLSLLYIACPTHQLFFFDLGYYRFVAFRPVSSCSSQLKFLCFFVTVGRGVVFELWSVWLRAQQDLM
jgi:hypothetical protein